MSMSFSGISIDFITMLIGIVLMNFLLILGFLQFRQHTLRLLLVIGATFVLNFLWVYFAIAMIGFYSLFLIVPLLLLDLVFYGLLKIRYDKKHRIITDLLFIACFTIALALVAMTNPGNLYLNTACLSIAFVIIAIPVYWPSSRSTDKLKSGSPLQRYMARVSLFSILLLSYLIPFLGVYARSAYCHWQNQAVAAPVMQAIEAYKADKGIFPSYIHEIHPEYLQVFPESVCRSPVGLLLNYTSYESLFLLDNCNGEFVSLYVRNGDSNQLNYDFLRSEFYFRDSSESGCWLVEGVQN